MHAAIRKSTLVVAVLSAATVLALAVPANAGPGTGAGAVAGKKIDVKVGATPPNAELVQSIPITRDRNRGEHVVMRLSSSNGHGLPNLQGGDRLAVMAELEVTVRPESYSYAPNVRARLLLTSNKHATKADGAQAVLLGDSSPTQCGQLKHHCMLVFRAEHRIGNNNNPCKPSTECYVNLVANAWSNNANSTDTLIIGENTNTGTAEGNKGSIGAVRIRPHSERGVVDTGQTGPAVKNFPVTDDKDGDRHVIFRKEIGKLHKGQQFSFDFTMTSNPDANFPIRVSTQVIVGKDPNAKNPIGGISPDGGKVSRFNGTNCISNNPCRTRHVGVFRAEDNFNQNLWLIVLAKSAAPNDDAGNGRYQVKIDGQLRFTQYVAS